ncbi:Meckel syndrome type 1 protein-like [Copidosoma floridanum]|uniref:Meckel syndrome type 1 protein-like n=1 Tax=Copidosoma floridanum TaxID=29053 RepID=UPI0006C94A4D|nr:Meckel syndrome type 1 protein-like [Copidosoma floridanum]
MLEPSKGKTKISGRYRVEQPMENFRIRVKIVQQKSLLAELFENEDETLDSNFLEAEEHEFAWQEKVFGPYEAKYYREERNCTTDQQKEYRRRLLEQTEDADGSRLYSYVQGDAYCPDPNPITGTYRSSLSVKNEQALPPLRNRKPFPERYNKQVVDHAPSDRRIRENHYLYTERVNMYIVVDLSPKDEGAVASTDSEALLCAISYDPLHQSLTVSPDFSTLECYSVDGIGMSYDFWLEHASQKPSVRELQRHRENMKKVSDFIIHLLYNYAPSIHEPPKVKRKQPQELQRIRSLKEAHLFHEILAPQPRVLRMYLSLDIGAARDFDSDDGVFVTYYLDLPCHWRPASEVDRRKLTGRTQRCRARNKQANLSYCAEVLLDLDLTELVAAKGTTELPAWPRVLISVASLDSWTRYRIEGYGSLALPAEAGSYNFSLKTWRPAAGLVDSLRRVFTGGTCELDDITYCAIPAMHEGPFLDKAPLKVVPSGCVELRLSVVHQSQSFARCWALGSGDRGEKLQAGKLLSSVEDVLNQFKAARERMIQARSMCS